MPAHATEADEPLYTRTVAWTVHAADELAASTVPVYRHLYSSTPMQILKPKLRQIQQMRHQIAILLQSLQGLPRMGSLPNTTTAQDVMDYHDSCLPERSLQHFWTIMQAAESHQTERIN